MLYNVPHTPETIQVFSFSNVDQHRQITDALLAQKGIALPVYPLDPIPMEDLATWAAAHQQSHNDFTKVLGIAGVDLTDVDFRDAGQLSAFISLHANEHMLAAQMLGIS